MYFHEVNPEALYGSSEGATRKDISKYSIILSLLSRLKHIVSLWHT